MGSEVLKKLIPALLPVMDERDGEEPDDIPCMSADCMQGNCDGCTDPEGNCCDCNCHLGVIARRTR